MKVLFVCSGNKQGQPGVVVYNQAMSMIKAGVQVDFFLIQGRGLSGYLQNVFPLYKYLKKKDFHVIHSHYSLSALVTSLSLLFLRSRPHVVSLMGSDTRLVFPYRGLVKFFSRFFWKKTIVKSKEMQQFLGLKKCLILPNGVDVNQVEAIEQAFVKMNSENSCTHNVLFAADPSREPKNFPLAKSAMEQVSAELNVVFNKKHEEVIKAIIKSDVVLLTSRWEGSPNIIKEAMSCNCPLVATDVGDIRWLFGNEPGHYICSFAPNDVAEKVQKALDFRRQYGRTNGRKRIKFLGLDSTSVAHKIIEVYKQVIK